MTERVRRIRRRIDTAFGARTGAVGHGECAGQVGLSLRLTGMTGRLR